MKRFSRLLILAALGGVGGCSGGGAMTAAQIAPTILAVEPPLALAGESVVITGTRFDDGLATPKVKFGGQSATVSSFNGSRMVVVVPNSAGSTLTVTDAGGTSLPIFFQLGARVTVPEIEPNDLVSGANATNASLNRTVSGTFQTASDKDLFKFGETLNKRFQVKVTPPDNQFFVYVNGQVVRTLSDGTIPAFLSTTPNLVIGVEANSRVVGRNYTISLVSNQ